MFTTECQSSLKKISKNTCIQKQAQLFPLVAHQQHAKKEQAVLYFQNFKFAVIITLHKFFVGFIFKIYLTYYDGMRAII